jgi:hypothetical protein
MNSNESKQCFNNEIRKRWPRWTPSDVEVSDWLGLAEDEETARTYRHPVS